MFCEKCGNSLQEGAVFCDACGTLVEGNKTVATEKPLAEAAPLSTPQKSEVPPVATVQPIAAPVKAEKKKDRRVNMLVMAFATFMCAVLLPIFSFVEPVEFDLYLTDLSRISRTGKDFTTMSEGEFTDKVVSFVDESLAEEETDSIEEEAAAESIKATARQFAEEAEPKIMQAASKLNRIFTLFFIVSMLILFAFVLLLVAAAREMKKMYRVVCIVLFAVFAGFIVLGSSFVDVEIAGTGSYITMLMLVLSFFLPFRKSKAKA